MTATVAHNAVVAGEGTIANRVEHPKLVGKCPSLLFVEPHQRCMQAKLLVHRKVERRVQALDEAIPAIRVTAEVCLPNARYDVVDAVIACIDGSDRNEEEIPSRHESRGVGVAFFSLCFNLEFFIGQAAFRTELRYETDIHAFPRYTSLFAKLLCYLNLLNMPLSIAETEGSHLVEMLESPIKASCGVLSARKNYESVGHNAKNESVSYGLNVFCPKCVCRILGLVAKNVLHGFVPTPRLELSCRAVELADKVLILIEL